MSYTFDIYETRQGDSDYTGRYQNMPRTMIVDGSPTDVVRDIKEANPFNEGAWVNIPEKPSPYDLDACITKREKAGACLYVVKKTSNYWYVEFLNNRFYLTSFRLGLKEKVQIMETFGSAVVSFFGDSVRIYEFGGVALDWLSSDFDNRYKNFQQSGLIHMYNNVIRGTKLVDNDRVAVMTVSNHFVYGYPFNLSVNYTSANEKLAHFTMSWVVTDHTMNYPYKVSESDLQNLYKVDVKFKDLELIDAPIDGADDILETPSLA